MMAAQTAGSGETVRGDLSEFSRDPAECPSEKCDRPEWKH